MTYTNFIIILIIGWLFVYFSPIFLLISFGLTKLNKEIFYLILHLFQLSFIYLTIYYLKEYRDNFRKDFSLFFLDKKKNIFLAIKYFIIYLLIFSFLVLLLSLVFHDKSSVYSFNSFSNLRVKNILIDGLKFKIIFVINVFLIAPVIEELYFRFMLLAKLMKKNNFMVAATLSSLFFAIFHFSNILVAFIDGLYLSYIYKKEDNIILNIIIHFILNLFSVILLIFLIS